MVAIAVAYLIGVAAGIAFIIIMAALFVGGDDDKGLHP